MEEAVSVREPAVWDALGRVIDPEVGLDIVTMGLVYGIEIDEGVVTVRYTLTTPGCPMEMHITNGVVAAVAALEGVRDVEPVLVWEPAWNPGMIAEGAWG
ncbi:MAG: metal-sulfur cluster assembly factor [Gemmatimonadota bacterium]